jgi:hypothetical protein
MQHEKQKLSNAEWMEFLIYLYNNVHDFNVSGLFMKDILGVLARFMDSTDYGDALSLTYLSRGYNRKPDPYVKLCARGNFDQTSFRGQSNDNARNVEVVYDSG